jgi:ribosomal protein S8
MKPRVNYFNEPLSKYFNICENVKEIIENMNDKEILKNLWVVSDKVIEFLNNKNKNATVRKVETMYNKKNATARRIEDVLDSLKEQGYVDGDADGDAEGGKRKSRRHLKRKSRKSRKTNKKASKKSKKSRKSRKSRR